MNSTQASPHGGAGLYIHIPFCRSKCPYCAFYSFRPDDETAEAYVNALIDTMSRPEKLLPDGMYLMEIKTAIAKPLWLADMLTEIGAVRSSFSKYGTEYKNFITKKNEKIAI